MAGRIFEVLAAATRPGLTSFGGPIAHLGYCRDEYVVRRKWVDEQAVAPADRGRPGPGAPTCCFTGGSRRGSLP